VYSIVGELQLPGRLLNSHETVEQVMKRLQIETKMELKLGLPCRSTDPIGAVCRNRSIPVRVLKRRFFFRTPGGKKVMKVLSPRTTFAQLRSEFPALDGRFFCGGREFCDSDDLTGIQDEVISIRNQYQFVSQLWAAPRFCCCDPNTTLATIIGPGSDYVFVYEGAAVDPQALIGDLGCSKDRPIVVKRQFPLVFRVDGKEGQVTEEFDDDSTVGAVKHKLFEATACEFRLNGNLLSDDDLIYSKCYRGTIVSVVLNPQT
jgi:hypothetical protein